MPPFYSDDAVTIWHGNALDLPLEDASVDLVVTSPPYFGLRAYSDGGETYGGQIGSEATPGEFIDALAAATAEMARVLKPGGSIFVNLGDKYNSAAGGGGNLLEAGHSAGGSNPQRIRGRASRGVPTKSLMLLPERYRIRCTDDLGLIARAVIVWDKPNGLPESVRDRVRRSHEDWVHLTKEPRYFTGIDEIREPHAPAGLARRAYGFKVNDAQRASGNPVLNGEGDRPANPLGKLPGSVWRIPTQPLRVPPELGIDHFAAQPMEWPRRIIRGWSPTGICVECGEGRRPVVTREALGRAGRDPAVHRQHAAGGSQTARREDGDFDRQQDRAPWREGVVATVTGYTCACDAPTAPTRPAVILDPFGGTGTTGVVAKALGRRAHLVDLSRDYCRLAQWRVNDPRELAKAAQVKPPAKRKAKVTKLRPAPTQESLLGDEPAA